MEYTKEDIKAEKDPKRRILMVLTEPLNATTKISQATGIHYYRVEKYLYELADEGKVEEVKVNKYKYWKLKNEN